MNAERWPLLPVRPAASPPARRAARLSLAGLGGFTALVVVLHGLRPEYNPVARFLSEYAIGPWGGRWPAALRCLAGGSPALERALRQTRAPTAWARRARRGLHIWIAGTTLAALFRTDLAGTPFTPAGIIHGRAATVAFVALIGSLGSLAHAYAATRQAAARPTALLAALTLLLLIVYFVSPVEVRGLTERLFVGAGVAGLARVAARLAR